MAEHIRTTEYTAADFLNWYKQRTLNLSPRFQRRPVWTQGPRSYFIDTVLRGYPAPPILVREQSADVKSRTVGREVVDGQQRLRTLISFIEPDLLKTADGRNDTFTLMKVHHPRFPRSTFADLPRPEQEQILGFKIVTHVFPSTTDDRDILELFARLNATGTRLNPQELRNAKYYGYFKTLSFSLATEQLNFWLDKEILSDKDVARMQEVELTSELLLLIERGIGEGGKDAINTAYKERDRTYPHRRVIAKRFRKCIDIMQDQFNFTGAGRFQNKLLFYCLFAALYDQVYGLGSDLKNSSSKSGAKTVVAKLHARAVKLSDGKAPPEVLAASQRRLTHRGEREIVINYLLGLK